MFRKSRNSNRINKAGKIISKMRARGVDYEKAVDEAYLQVFGDKKPMLDTIELDMLENIIRSRGTMEDVQIFRRVRPIFEAHFSNPDAPISPEENELCAYLTGRMRQIGQVQS